MHDERGLVEILLRDVADDPRFSTREHELRALSEAVGAGNGREAVWRGIQLEQTFTPETTIRLTPRKRRRVAGAIGAFAAIVVFLPVWWTWMSFQSAAQTYQQWLGARAAAAAEATEVVQSESFLQLWATGFPGDNGVAMLAPQHWLPNVAAWSTFLILLCILLIVGERLMARSADRADDDEYQECSARLASALNFAQITVNSRNVQDPVQGLDIIREAVEELLAAHQQTREAAGVLRETAQSLEASTSRVTSGLEASANRLTAGFKTSTVTLLGSFQQSVDDLVKALEAAVAGTSSALLGSVGGITQNLERSVTHASGALESSVTTAVGSLNASVGQVALASTGMQQAVTASASAQQELAKAAAGLAANTQTMEASLRQQIADAADAINREVEQLRAEAVSLSQNTGQVGSSLGQHTSALQHQITELTQIRASLERVSGLGLVGASTAAAGR